MSLHKIIKELQDTQGNKAKQAILDANKGNAFLMQYMKAVYDPAINYYQTKLPKYDAGIGNTDFNEADLREIVDVLASRELTGDRAKTFLVCLLQTLNKEGQELVRLLIKRSIGASVGETMVLKTWPGLFFVPPYMRCSLMDDKIKAKFEKEADFFIQLKADGSFAYLLVDRFNEVYKVITRNGNTYPPELAKRLSVGLPDGVYVGELEVWEAHYGDEGQECLYLCDRKTGNGKLNSLLQGDTTVIGLGKYEVFMSAWDYLTVEEFEEGYSDRNYAVRFDELCAASESAGGYLNVIDTHIVESLEEAYKIYSKYTSEGKEGAIIKTCGHKWKDGTSKECVKLKIEFEADYVVIGAYEGEGKAAGMLGGLVCSSNDGKIVFSVGSGFTDEQRKEFWNDHTVSENIVGKIVTVKANDIVSKRDSDTLSLFLPIFIEFRPDKQNIGADSYDRVVEQLNACKGIA